MSEFIIAHYEWFRAFHIISVMAWMAGMLYLPRLYVYHADAAKGGELSETLKIMERRLLRIIINPAMIASFIFGGLMLYARWDYFMHQGWMHAKLGLILLMVTYHGFLARWRKAFERDENKYSAKFYRMMNEVPTLLMILIVILAVAEPF